MHHETTVECFTCGAAGPHGRMSAFAVGEQDGTAAYAFRCWACVLQDLRDGDPEAFDDHVDAAIGGLLERLTSADLAVAGDAYVLLRECGVITGEPPLSWFANAR